MLSLIFKAYMTWPFLWDTVIWWYDSWLGDAPSVRTDSQNTIVCPKYSINFVWIWFPWHTQGMKIKFTIYLCKVNPIKISVLPPWASAYVNMKKEEQCLWLRETLTGLWSHSPRYAQGACLPVGMVCRLDHFGAGSFCCRGCGVVHGCSALGARSLSMGWLDCWSVLSYRGTLVLRSKVFFFPIYAYIWRGMCIHACGRVYTNMCMHMCVKTLTSSYLVLLLVIVVGWSFFPMLPVSMPHTRIQAL